MNAPVLDSPEDALTLALILSLTAPSKRDEREAIAVAEDLARGMTEIEVARCKRRAIQRVDVAPENEEDGK